jgi:hypothetical protein
MPEQTQSAAAAPRAAMPLYTPVPSQHENDSLAATQASGAPLPLLPWFHKADGSPIDPQSYSQTVGAPTWP